jgi:hypothetical protein
MIKQKSQSGNTWIQEDGSIVEKKRLFPYEIKSERYASKIFNASVKIEELLTSLSALIDTGMVDVQTAYLKQKSKIKKDKEIGDHVDGGFTFYSFDKKVKVERIVVSLIDYDPAMLLESKNFFMEYLKEFGEDPEILILGNLIISAYSTKRGKLDVKKLDTLLSYKTKIDNEKFGKAIELLEQARRESKTKKYYNVYFKDSEGKYQQVNLRISGVSQDI